MTAFGELRLEVLRPLTLAKATDWAHSSGDRRGKQRKEERTGVRDVAVNGLVGEHHGWGFRKCFDRLRLDGRPGTTSGCGGSTVR